MGHHVLEGRESGRGCTDGGMLAQGALRGCVGLSETNSLLALCNCAHIPPTQTQLYPSKQQQTSYMSRTSLLTWAGWRGEWPLYQNEHHHHRMLDNE